MDPVIFSRTDCMFHGGQWSEMSKIPRNSREKWGNKQKKKSMGRTLKRRRERER